MKYKKPEINALGEASNVIRDMTKAITPGFDSIDPTNPMASNSAYDLDE